MTVSPSCISLVGLAALATCPFSRVTVMMRRLTGLLEHTLDFLGVPELKAIPIAILDYVEAVPPELVQRVSGVRNMLPVRIKRKIWQVDIEQFRKDV